MRNLSNFLLFQSAWLLNVLMPGRVSALLTLLIVSIHLSLVSRHFKRELRFIFMTAGLGIGVDILLQNMGVLRFPTHTGAYSEGMIPLWLVSIWLVFATTVNHCFYGLRHHLGFMLGLVPMGAAAAYYAAAHLGAMEIGYSLWGILCIALVWLALFPVFIHISRWLETVEGRPDNSKAW